MIVHKTTSFQECYSFCSKKVAKFPRACHFDARRNLNNTRIRKEIKKPKPANFSTAPGNRAGWKVAEFYADRRVYCVL